MQNTPCRRNFLRTATAATLSTALALPSLSATQSPQQGPVRARRPKPPYRVWFQPTLFVRDLDLFPHMTIDAGWLDPRLAEAHGKTTLQWVYGLNHPYATGPDYWRDACSVQSRSYPQKSDNPTFVAAGISIDEWVPPRLPDNERWLAEGLRAGKRDNPDLFVAVWSTDPTPALIDLTREGTVDLVIVQAYTHAAAEAGPGLTISWDGGLRRCDALASAGLEAKTILSFGHVTARPSAGKTHFTEKALRAHAEDLKRRYPAMPGVAFYQHTRDEDTPEFRALVRACDRLSAELWPNRP